MKIHGEITLFDEKFNFFTDEDIVIQHPVWQGILGHGETMNDALSDLAGTIQGVKPIYCKMADKLLSSDGIEMRDWLEKVVVEELR